MLKHGSFKKNLLLVVGTVVFRGTNQESWPLYINTDIHKVLFLQSLQSKALCNMLNMEDPLWDQDPKGQKQRTTYKQNGQGDSRPMLRSNNFLCVYFHFSM